MTRSHHAHAFVCVECRHLGSRHRLVEGGELRAGPYRCPCGCEQPQDGAFIELSRAQYEAAPGHYYDDLPDWSES